MSSQGQAGFFGPRSVAAKLACAAALVGFADLAASFYVMDRAAFGGAARVLLVQAISTVALALVVFLSARMLVGTPLGAMARRIEAFAAGDLETEVVHHPHGDEIGAIARSLDGLRLAGLEKRVAEEARAAALRATEERRRESDGARAAAAKLQAAVLRLIGAVLARVAEGDLTARLKVEFPGDCRNLRDDFNLAMDRLQDTMNDIVATGRQVRTDAAEIHRAAVALAKRAAQQAAGSEQVAAAAKEVIRSLSETASGVREARSAVEAVIADAGRSGQVVSQAIVAMGGIEKSSQEIHKIIGVIDEIAFQTNLLALNAGVEAARAGEAGRGFVVVAQEVRALARRSAEAAKEIKALISASAGQVKNGTKLVAETGETIGRITEKVGNISGIVTVIAKSADEQATGLRDINTVLNSIGTATRENAAAAEQFTAASRNLARGTRSLATLAGNFRTDAADKRPALDNLPPAPRPPMPSTHGATALALGNATPPRAEDGWQAQ